MLLVAAHGMADPRFQHAVVLLVRHGEDGTMGLIINRPTTVRLFQALANLKHPERATHTLFFGGPVQLDVMMFLVHSPMPVKNADRVSQDLYLSASRNTLEAMLANGKEEDELRIFAGYAGWAPGQLDAELAHGDWHLVPGNPQAIFRDDPIKVWRELIDREEPDGIRVERAPLSAHG